MKSILKYKRHFAIITLFITAFILRFVNLGYSDYQGDEIKAFYLPDEGQTPMQFLLDQRKGPLQFIITLLIKPISQNYDQQFVSRFLFALAGVLSVVVFYRLVEIFYGKRIAFIAAFLLSTNGFFVALSRIVQYQSFVILFSILTLYFFSKSLYVQRNNAKLMYLGFMSWAIAFLAHYDALFILPFALYLLFKIVKKTKTYKNVGIGALLFLLLTLWFYIPFIFYVTDATKDYWTGRLTGDVSSKLSSSRYLFTVYQPIYVVHFYTFLALIFVAGVFILIAKILLSKKFQNSRILLFINKLSLEHMYTIDTLFVAIWFLIGILFWELVVYIPGTHIYTYLIPLFILLGVGLNLLEKGVFSIFIKTTNVSFKVVHGFFYVGVFTISSFIFLQSYAVFVDNRQEYPWEEERFLNWTFNKPTPIFHLSMFGFPYYRDWEGIRNFAGNVEGVTHYSTNERDSISRYYIRMPKDTDKAGLYVYIYNPQSFTNEVIQKKANYWISKYDPIFTFSRYGETMVAIYKMEQGSMEEIIAKGF